MRGWLSMFAVAGLAATALPAPAAAQPLPPGSYQGQCRDIRMSGTFLSATCSAPGGAWGQSQINVPGCQGREIYVDREGGLACNVNERPITRPPPADGYPPPRPPVVRPPPPGGGWGGGGAITVYERRGFRGASERFSDDIPNLARSGLNDRIRSIQVGRRGTWEVCSDAYFRGRCRTITRDVSDTRAITMEDNISSIRRVR